MAKLSREDVLKLARLARLRLSEDEISRFTDEIGAVLQYVEQLQNIDLTDVIPTSQVTGLTNVERADEIFDYGVTPDELLKNAPATEGGQIKTRRILA